jgi:hypothetical protein
LHARLSSHQLLRDPWFIFNSGSVRCERVFLCGLYLCAGAGVNVMMAIATEQPDIPNNAKWIGFVVFYVTTQTAYKLNIFVYAIRNNKILNMLYQQMKYHVRATSTISKIINQ